MTRIIITEVKSPYGKYWKFTIKGKGTRVAEVDKKRKSDFGYNGYVLYGGGGLFSEIARHSNKGLVLEMAKEYIRGFIPDAEFKWDVTVEI